MKTSSFLLSAGLWISLVASAGAQVAKPEKDAPLDPGFLRNYAETRGFMLGRPTNAQPAPDGKSVLFLRAQARTPKMRLYEFDVATAKTRELLTPEQLLKGAEEKLTPEEKARRERMRVSVGGFSSYQLSGDGSLILLSLSGKLYLFRRADNDVRELNIPAGVLDPQFAPDGKSVAYVRDHDVYVYDLAAGKERRITTGGTERISHGLAEFVAQEEMDRFSGYWWSPDSQFIVYEEADAGDVEIWYVADPAHPDRPAHTSFYPRPGKNNVKVRLGIVPVAGGETVWIDWDAKKYPYLARVNWGKHGPLTIQVQTREQKELVLLKVDPKTGKTSPLVTETDKDWVNLQSGVPHWLEDGKRFLWISERDGGLQLELREAETGKLLHVLVSPKEGFQGLVDVNEKAGEIVYRACADPTQSHLFSSSFPDENEKRAKERFLASSRLTEEKGMHGFTYSKDHSIYVHSFTPLDGMPKTTVHKRDGTLIGSLESVAEEPPFKPQMQIVKVGEEQGFYAVIVRPRRFDPKMKYPVIVDVYGGPHANKVRAAMNTQLMNQWLADQGFIVVSIDGRGTPGRGRDWERAIAKKFGSVPLDDQVAGLKALGKQFPEMDMERVGITGWSFGGYMSALAVLKRPDVYKAGIAGAPVTDWLDYDTHYTERYLGLPDKDEAAYKESSLLPLAAELSRPLLIIHGTADDNVYFRHSLKLNNALFRAGKDFEMLPLSGLTHMVPDPVVMERLRSRMALFFQKHLGKPKTVSSGQ